MIAERILMGLLLGGVAIGCVLVLYPFLSALLWAGILVFTTWPVFDWLRLHLHLRRFWAALLMVTLTAVVLVLPIGVAAPLDVPAGAGRRLLLLRVRGADRRPPAPLAAPHRRGAG
jgi:predicted PurR-regulated permease PerM